MLLLDPSLPAPVDRATGERVTEVERRIGHLVGSLHKDRTKIIVPTPVLAEVLTRAERAGADYFTKLNRSAAFQIVPFGTQAAIELARMTAMAIQGGDKRGGLSAPWTKIKFDRQVVAIARVAAVKTVYSDDGDLRKLAEDHGIEVIAIGELPLPPEDRQMNFAWEAQDDAASQRDRFIETARELDCDEDEGRFNETLKWIVPKTGETNPD